MLFKKIILYTCENFLNTIDFPVIRGADVIARTAVEFTPDQPFSFHWEHHGIKVHIPAGAIRRERGRVTLCIQASLSGDYQLPNDDGVLVSGVYWLSLHPHVERFEKQVSVTLQHCVNDDASSISFITAKCTQEVLPYTFKSIPGGLFRFPREGTIQVHHFSSVAASAKSSKLEYAVCSYYMQKGKHDVFDVYITVTQNHNLQLQVCLNICLKFLFHLFILFSG